MLARDRSRGDLIQVILVGLLLSSCNLDSDEPAPEVAAPTERGACGTTETLFPKLLAYVRQGRMEPLRRIIRDRMVESETNPVPKPELRTVIAAMLRVVSQLGLDQTGHLVDLAAQERLEEQLGPFTTTVLKFVDGQYDDGDHYACGDAAALFVRVCNPDHLLAAIEHLLRLRSPSHEDELWLVAVLEAAGPMVNDPTLLPFLESFERNAERGRPAVISIMAQVMGMIADEGFTISRVETLLESAVYPAVEPVLESQLRELVVLLGEATNQEAGVFEPIQEAVRCGMRHGEERDELLGFIYDFLATEEVALETLYDAAGGVIGAAAIENEVALLSDVVHVIREDLTVRDDLTDLLAMLLSRPQIDQLVPMLTELVEEGVVVELLHAIVSLLEGCGRD